MVDASIIQQEWECMDANEVKVEPPNIYENKINRNKDKKNSKFSRMIIYK